MRKASRHSSSVMKNTVNQTKKIPWSSFLIVIIPLLCLLGAYTVYHNWSSWLEALDREPIKSYAVTHKMRFTNNSDIRAVLSKEPALKGYFGQDIQELKERFLAISWVKDVVVRKIYPNRLSITLSEHIPVAHWNNDYFISAQGVVFELPKDRFKAEGLPILFGPDQESLKVLNAWSKIKQDLNTRHLVLRAVKMDSRGSWTITLDNNIELRLGRGEWIDKIDRFVDIFPQIEIPEGKRLAYVDLRYEHGAAVGFSP